MRASVRASVRASARAGASMRLRGRSSASASWSTPTTDPTDKTGSSCCRRWQGTAHSSSRPPPSYEPTLLSFSPPSRSKGRSAEPNPHNRAELREAGSLNCRASRSFAEPTATSARLTHPHHPHFSRSFNAPHTSHTSHTPHTPHTSHTSHTQALRYASEALRADRSIVLAAVTNDPFGQAASFAADELRRDRSVMLAAVSACGMALVHVSDGLKRDTEVCIAAILSDPRAAAAVGSVAREDPGVQAALQEAAERRARDEEEKARARVSFKVKNSKS